jgi:hypothetical protein
MGKLHAMHLFDTIAAHYEEAQEKVIKYYFKGDNEKQQQARKEMRQLLSDKRKEFKQEIDAVYWRDPAVEIKKHMKQEVQNVKRGL